MDPGSHTVRKASLCVSRSADACTYMSDHVMYIYIYVMCKYTYRSYIILYHIILYYIILYYIPEHICQPQTTWLAQSHRMNIGNCPKNHDFAS